MGRWWLDFFLTNSSSDLALVVRILSIKREVIHGFVILGPQFCQCCLELLAESFVIILTLADPWDQAPITNSSLSQWFHSPPSPSGVIPILDYCQCCVDSHCEGFVVGEFQILSYVGSVKYHGKISPATKNYSWHVIVVLKDIRHNCQQHWHLIVGKVSK